MSFFDYRTTFDDFKKAAKHIPDSVFYKKFQGIDRADYRSVYKYELQATAKHGDDIAGLRMMCELMWYQERRPYFNVYPIVEKKLLELNSSIELDGLSLPFSSIEVRVNRWTVLIGDIGKRFIVVVQFPDNEYQELAIYKSGSIEKVSSSLIHYVERSNPAFGEGKRHLNQDQQRSIIYIVAGVCLLAKDNTIVSPVILNSDRRENLTPERLAELATKAINRTGRIGFDVGREIERMKATAHYRNGCFAKYYVGKDHECYPSKSELKLAPVIKWRSGAVVNKDNLPNVPTGFKDSNNQDLLETR